MIKPRARTCPRCGKKFNSRIARQQQHTGVCSLACMPGGVGKPRRSAEERREAKKLRLQQQKQTQYHKNKRAEFYDSREWRELRFKVLRRYGPTCMLCFRPGARGFPMHIDHIKPRSKYPDLELEFDNLQILCPDCNLGKCNYTEDDFRPHD